MHRLLMSTNLNSKPIEELREYLIVINPPAKVNEKVKSFKKECDERFGNALYVNSKPHISLSHFHIESTPETTIYKELYDVLKDWSPFKIELSGFDTFPTSNTLFIDTSVEEIVKLQNYMVAILRKRAKINKRDTQKLKKPHLTIASGIADSQFYSSWKHFNDKQYAESFVVEKITVLRRNPLQRGSNYHVAFDVFLKGQKKDQLK